MHLQEHVRKRFAKMPLIRDVRSALAHNRTYDEVIYKVGIEMAKQGKFLTFEEAEREHHLRQAKKVNFGKRN